jgi:hypothetical protein
LINNGQLQQSLEQDDKVDNDYDDILKRRGVSGQRNSFYYAINDQDFYIDVTDKQLSKFRYDKKNSIFYGMESKDCNDFNRQEVSREWIEENFGNEFVEHVVLCCTNENSTKYYEVCPGSVIPIDQKYHNPKNPKIKYQQEEERTCVFCSMASILYDLGHIKTSELIYMKKDEFLESLGNKDLHNNPDAVELYQRKNKKRKTMPEPNDIPKPTMFLEWLPFIQYYMWAITYEHNYMSCKINRTFDLFRQVENMKDDEFILAGLRATDGGQDHAICINKRYIYDSNYEHAVTFSKDALNACCPPGFQFINSGYYYHKRTEKMKTWLLKKDDDEIKRILNL